jgi:hypothetical protein
MKKILFFLLISIKAFSQGSVKISDMPPATSLNGTEIVPIVQGGINKKATVSLWPNNTIVVSSNTTAVNDAVYTVVASATFTDPTPVEGKGFTVFIRNGTGTVGGTGYSVAGTQIRRIFHSGSWANYTGGGGGGGGISGLTSGRLTFATSGTTIGDDAAFTVDATIGRLNVIKSQDAGSNIVLVNNSTGSSASATFVASNDLALATVLQFGVVGINSPSGGIFAPDVSLVRSTVSGGLNIGSTNSGQVSFYTNNVRRGGFLAGGDFDFVNSVSVNGSIAMGASTALDIQGTTKALKIGSATRASISTPLSGHITNDTNVPYFHNGTAWSAIPTAPTALGTSLQVLRTNAGGAATEWAAPSTKAANWVDDLSSTVTAAGTTTLTVSSNKHQVFTGSTTQTMVLPNATTLTVGHLFVVHNQSSGVVTVQTNGGATIRLIAGGFDAEFVCTSIGTAAGTWEIQANVNTATGKGLTVNHSLTLAGTDATTMTFPSTSATIARTDAANTFTGIQSMTSPAITTRITTPSASFDAFNTTATTLNLGGAATTLTLGATTGTMNLRNVTLTAANATSFNMNGASPAITTTNTGTAAVFNTAALTGNLFGASTTIGIGNTVTGAQTVNIGTASTGASTYNFGTGATAGATIKTINLGTGGAASSTTNVNIGSTNGGQINMNRKMVFQATETAAGTTGSQTINQPSGSVNFAAAATSIVVTNSFATATSHIFCTIETNDATATIKNVVRAAGSFTINLNAAATAETRVGFLVIN